ncbi:MAG: hypothetical protein V1793_17865 [Pseudomonadota bacterium]
MKAILAEYGGTKESIAVKDGAETEDWPAVCERYNDDVHRVCDVTDIQGYTALYECFDDRDKPLYYLVQEDAKLYRLRRRHFLGNIG